LWMGSKVSRRPHAPARCDPFRPYDLASGPRGRLGDCAYGNLHGSLLAYAQSSYPR
jgi:hypothetical protein